MQKKLQPKISEKHWDKSIELKLMEIWKREGIDQFPLNLEAKKPLLVIDTPPPYPSGKWHVGGAAHYTQIDMIARYFRMKGWNVLVPWYADRNGLPIEVAVEKKYGITAHEVASTPEGRLKFLELCRRELDKVEKELIAIWRRLGCSFEYWANGTDSEEYRKLTQTTFIELWRRGLVYEAEKPVTWCPRCKTSLSEAEVEHKERIGVLYYVKWRVKETGESIIIATTRPELIAATRAVAFNPRDERYTKLKGLHAIVPIYGYEVPIIEHPSVDPGFGTGLVMVSSYGDWTDVMMISELGLEPRVVVNRDGRLNDKAGFLKGLNIEEARRKIVEELKERRLIEKEEKIVQSIPVCWRCKTPVEIIHVKEYFLKQLKFKEELKQLALKMKIKPEKHRKKLLDWIESLKMDWPISRTRYYGTEIPIWICRRCGAKIVPEPGKYYRPWIDEPPFERCPSCGAPREELVGETRVFDTWFDSSISVLYVSGYLRNLKLFEKAYPKESELPYTLRPQGIDIIRTWLHFSILRVWLLLGKPAFRWVRLSGMGLDPKGRAMHKSLGNVIDPEPVIEKYGADAFRYWAAAAARLGDDYRFSEQLVRTGQLFASKIWNLARFASMFPRPSSKEVKLRALDEAILARLNTIIREVDKAFGEDLDTHRPAILLYEFIWNEFAAHYVEMVKNRAYNKDAKYGKEEQKASWYTLHLVLDYSLRMLAPIMPFVTDYLYRRIYGETVHLKKFPEPLAEVPSAREEEFKELMEINSSIWSIKKKSGIKLSQALPGATLYLKPTLRDYIMELEDLHHISVVVSEEAPENSIKITNNAYLFLEQA